MKKGVGTKGQVSVFIIIAIIIFLGVVLVCFFAFTNKNEIKKFIDRRSVSSELLPVYDALSSCSNQRTIDAIRIVGLQGGYITLPQNYLKTEISNVAFGYYNGKNTLASKKTIEKEISGYIDDTIPYCLNQDDFSNLNLTIGEPITSVQINKDSISISTKLPVTVSKEKTIYKIDRSYDYEIPVRLGDIHDIANDIVENIKKDPKNIPLSFLALQSYNVLVDQVDSENDLYLITDKNEKNKLEGVAFSFIFAVKKNG